MKKLLLSFVLLLSLSAFSQSINDYQYVIVPIKFDFLKQNDRYRLNTTTKLLLQKYNFKSYLSTDEMPSDATSDRCSILYASLVEENNFFVTKIKVVLKDCMEKIVFETDFGTSREKDFHVAYNQALREAFKSFDKLNYQYNGKQPATKTTATLQQPEVPATPVVPAAELPKAAAVATTNATAGQLYAQPITNGFQLINTEPKVVYKIYKTSVQGYYIASKGEQQGVFFAKDNGWVFEYYQNNELLSERVDVKF